MNVDTFNIKNSSDLMMIWLSYANCRNIQFQLYIRSVFIGYSLLKMHLTVRLIEQNLRIGSCIVSVCT